MRGVNKAIIVGNLGQDPETRMLAGGNSVCNFNVATSESWKDKDTGEKVEKTEWHRITMFGKLAEIAAQYLVKGSAVYLEGKIQTSKYTKDGVERYATSIVCNQMQMLGSKPDSDNKPYAKAASNSPAQQDAIDDFDDDIVF